MKKAVFFILSLLLIPVVSIAADNKTREFSASGQIETLDPVYSQVTIRHGAIKGFGGDSQTQFYVSSPDLLKGLSRYDLVDFHFIDTKGDVRIDKITKTGEAAPDQAGVPVGDALGQTLQGAGQIVQAVTSPIAPVSEAVGGAVDSTSDSTDPRIVDGELKQKVATF